ncbi:MAG: HEAT repeat domain-containing protein [Planctomycetes bacterium]|nr:HEAT repeat domain-containing protein [Planctomycetota bacterium]
MHDGGMLNASRPTSQCREMIWEGEETMNRRFFLWAATVLLIGSGCGRKDVSSPGAKPRPVADLASSEFAVRANTRAYFTKAENRDSLRGGVRSENKEVRACSAILLAAITDGGDAEILVPVLREGLGSADESIRRGAAQGLCRLGLPAADALDDLLERLADGSETEDVKWDCAHALRTIGRDDKKIADSVFAMLEANALDGSLASITVGDMRHIDQAPFFLHHLGNSNPAVRWLATNQIGDIVRNSDNQAVTGWEDLLRQVLRASFDASPLVRESAVFCAISFFGWFPSANASEATVQEIVDCVLRGTTDSASDIRNHSTCALARLFPPFESVIVPAHVRARIPEVVASLSARIEDPEQHIRLKAVHILANAGKCAAAAVPALRARLPVADDTEKAEIERAIVVIAGG